MENHIPIILNKESNFMWLYLVYYPKPFPFSTFSDGEFCILFAHHTLFVMEDELLEYAVYWSCGIFYHVACYTLKTKYQIGSRRKVYFMQINELKSQIESKSLLQISM